MPKNYIDIGHGDPKAILWAHADGKIQSFVAGEDTHESVWGLYVMNSWRGRFDKKTNEISVVAPTLFRGSDVPQWLLDKLESKFGTGLQTWRFNPVKEGKRIK